MICLSRNASFTYTVDDRFYLYIVGLRKILVYLWLDHCKAEKHTVDKFSKITINYTWNFDMCDTPSER